MIMKEQSRGTDKNYRTHIQALSLTKLADGLLDPKLVLAWLLTVLGASATWVGMLVPVREAGALLPQLLTAEPIRRLPVRKWAWIVGSVVQGAAAAGIAVAALVLEGAAAGATIVALVALLAIARSVSSVSYKDVLGKTVEKERRGRVSGTAAAIAATGVLVFGLLLLFGVFDRFAIVVSALGVAGVLWVLAALVFTRLHEEPSAPPAETEDGVVRRYLRYLRSDGELQKLILARGLLLATAIAPPYLILLAGEAAGTVFTQIGALVIASSLAAFVSGRIWGVFSDRSTPMALTTAGAAAAASLLAAVLAAGQGYFSNMVVLPGLLFVLMVAYQGVRIGRATQLVNIANEDTRTAYTAISNTIIGVALLLTGGLGLLVPIVGLSTIVVLLAVSCLAGALVASRMQA